jgi:hypothetical protein
MVKKAFYLVVPIGRRNQRSLEPLLHCSVVSVGLLLPLAAFGGWRLGPVDRPA